MKRSTLAALGILLLLGVIYLLTSSSPRQTAQSPLTIDQVEGLSRIKIDPPANTQSTPDAGTEGESSEPAETVVLEKRSDGWWLTKPVESPAASSVESTIDELFSGPIETDGLDVTGSKSEYGLGSAGVTLSLFGGDGSEPSVQLVVGDQTDVSGTGAKRTYIRKPDDSTMYRARAALGDFVQQPVDDFRSDKIVEVDEKKLTRLQWKQTDGPTIVLERDSSDDDWSMARPQVDWSLATETVGNITGVISGLNADDFADDKSKSDIGLDPPAARMTFSVGGGGDGKKASETTILLGKVGDGDDTKYYVKRADKPFLYKVTSYAGEKLHASLESLRSKTPRTFDQKAITEVQFPGEDSVVVRKEEGSWSLVQPDAEKSLNESKLKSKLSKIAELTVSGFPDVKPNEVGLGLGAEQLEFKMKNGDQYAIKFGDTTGEEGSNRYVQFSDGEEVFTISEFNDDALHPKVDDLVGKSKGGPGKGMPKGMPGGMKGGMKKKIQQMKMKKMLRRKMRQRGK